MNEKMTDDDELLLPSIKEVGPKDGDKLASGGGLFKCYIIVMMTLLLTGYTITVRHTRLTGPPNEHYYSTTVVYLSELVKLIVALLCLFKMSNFNIEQFVTCIKNDLVGKPLDMVKMSVPSIAYALQNNLDFIALSNLDSATYQVTTQLKIVTTAIFMVIILGRKFSNRRWVAILLLFLGVATVQLSAIKVNETKKSEENYAVGLIAVLITCVTAGFAGVYFEMMLKDGAKTPFWIRNLQMYLCGVISSAVGCILFEKDYILDKGFFYGYSRQVIAIILLLSFGGIFISLVMKYLDNLHKSFASAVSIILVAIVSFSVFDDVNLNFAFVSGSIAVCSAILLYNSVSE